MDAIGAMDMVDVGNGLGVLVGMAIIVRVGKIAGVNKFVGCIFGEFGVEVHPAIIIRVIKTNVLILILNP